MSAVFPTTSFTPAEAAALSGLSEKQVRKELEYRVIETSSTPRLSFAALVYLCLVRRSQLPLPVAIRARLFQQLRDMLDVEGEVRDIEVAEPFYLRVGPLFEELLDKVERFAAWKARMVEDPDIMGGATVFPGTRLTVRHIGGMLERGIDPQEIREDYPELTEEDLSFSRLFVRAYPKVGRPRRST